MTLYDTSYKLWTTLYTSSTCASDPGIWLHIYVPEFTTTETGNFQLHGTGTHAAGLRKFSLVCLPHINTHVSSLVQFYSKETTREEKTPGECGVTETEKQKSG